ncbi:autoinducer synthesis protein [Salinisphaera hydrothermalis EPR70]
MFTLRAQVFNGRQKWALPTVSGKEIDDFDNNRALYMLGLSCITNDVVACWRMIPTAFDTMIHTVFTDLLPADHDIARNNNVWELSRFAIKKGFSPRTNLVASGITRSMFAALKTFATEREIERYVTVLSPSLHRLLSRSGLTMPRFDSLTDTQRRHLGRTACYIEIDELMDEFIQNRPGNKNLDQAI